VPNECPVVDCVYFVIVAHRNKRLLTYFLNSECFYQSCSFSATPTCNWLCPPRRWSTNWRPTTATNSESCNKVRCHTTSNWCDQTAVHENRPKPLTDCGRWRSSVATALSTNPDVSTVCVFVSWVVPRALPYSYCLRSCIGLCCQSLGQRFPNFYPLPKIAHRRCVVITPITHEQQHFSQKWPFISIAHPTNDKLIP